MSMKDRLIIVSTPSGKDDFDLGNYQGPYYTELCGAPGPSGPIAAGDLMHVMYTPFWTSKAAQEKYKDDPNYQGIPVYSNARKDEVYRAHKLQTEQAARSAAGFGEG